MKGLIALRRSRKLLSLQSFLHDEKLRVDVTWLRPDGADMQDDDWHTPEARALGMRLQDSAQGLLVLFNSHFDEVAFRLPDPLQSDDWACLVDSDSGALQLNQPPRIEGRSIAVAPRSILMLEDTQI